MNTGDVKYIKYERKRGYKKKVGDKDLHTPGKYIYLKRKDISMHIYRFLCPLSFLEFFSITVYIKSRRKKKNTCLVSLNALNKTGKVQTTCARNRHILSIWKSDICFIYAARGHLSSQLIVVGQLA